MKLITFSLWGIDLKYLKGALRNAELAKEIYPDWTCRFYVGKSVPYPFILQLKSFDNVQIVEKEDSGDWRGMFWRFEPASETGVEAMISRDTDSRLNMREKAAVDAWLASDKGFHIMRDHPFHKFPVLGGMWGAKSGTVPNMKELIDGFSQEDKYGTDYEFFATVVMPIIKDNIMVHDEFFGGEPFPTLRQDYQFVGQVFDETENTAEEHQTPLVMELAKRELYIHHHLGLGDHLDCNAMVRLYLKSGKFSRVCLFAKNNYADLIRYMFRDEPRIVIVPVDKGDEYGGVKRYIEKHRISNFIRVGHENYPWGQEEALNMGCAEIFYKQVGVDYQQRFESFYFERDVFEEERVYDKLNPNHEEYVFVHDDRCRGFEIPDEKIYELNDGEIKIIRNDMSENIFHFIKVLENAKQIHCMESCFRSLVETTKVTGALYFHNFRTGASGFLGNSTRQPWQEIEW